MRDLFHGYYPPTSAEYKTLWEKGLIVVDTNILLSLYRLPTLARDEYLNVLEGLKERLWIPHQVALEFQNNRLKRISEQRKATEDTLKSAKEVVSALCVKVEGLQIDKRGLDIDTASLIANMKAANDALIVAVQTTHDSLPDISTEDKIRDRLDAIFQGRIGRGPATQEELDKLIENADHRYENEIPPGFADAGKDKNPNEAAYIFDHLKYPRKFGDLIVWRQILEHVKQEKKKSILFITSDNKEDWWWKEQGKTIGPHRELTREIKREAEIDHFWMYSADQFIKQAQIYNNATVSSKTIEEVEIASRDIQTWGKSLHDFNLKNRAFLKEVNRLKHYGLFHNQDRSEFGLISSVMDWASVYGEVANASGGPFDFYIGTDDGITAVEVKVKHSSIGELTLSDIFHLSTHGKIEAIQRKCNKLIQIIVLPSQVQDSVESKISIFETIRALAKFIDADPNFQIEIVAGTVEDGIFRTIASVKVPD